MRINFVSFLHPETFHGGGELDNRMLIEEGRRLGHDIRIGARVSRKYLHRIMHPVWELHEEPDLWILSDLFNVPEYGLTYRKGFLEAIIGSGNYVHIDNAYVDVCGKGALPCGGDRSLCSGQCSVPLSRDIYANSLLNVFLSPLHANTINKMFGQEFAAKSFIVRPLVSPALFYNRHLTRDISYLYVGTVSQYKGYRQIKEMFGHEPEFLFIGKNATGEPLFGKHLEHVDNNRLIDYYNRARNFVHLPAWKEPMGRTIVEAALCGCNIISNENAGACSFDFEISDPANIEGAAAGFWTKIATLKRN